MIAFWVVAGTLYIAGILELACARQLAIFGAEPDFLLIAVGCCSMALRRTPAAVCGFAGGVIQGAIAGADMAHYAISRTVGGFVASWSRSLRLEANPAAVAATVALTTVLSRMLFMFTAAPRGIAEFLGDTIGTAMYNGVLAIPLYALLKRVLNPPVR